MAHILLLEDNLVFSQLICASLFEEGHEVVACVDATSAYDAFCGQRFDLVIADIIVRKDGQPVPDGGLSLISKVKRLCKVHNRKVPIIAISGAVHNYGMEYMLVLAGDMGAQAVLAKPFAPNQLIEKIDTLLDQRNA